MTSKRIAAIKARATELNGPAKTCYLMGIRDGMDLSIGISDDGKGPLSKDKNFEHFRNFVDWLEKQSIR